MLLNIIRTNTEYTIDLNDFVRVRIIADNAGCGNSMTVYYLSSVECHPAFGDGWYDMVDQPKKIGEYDVYSLPKVVEKYVVPLVQSMLKDAFTPFVEFKPDDNLPA